MEHREEMNCGGDLCKEMLELDKLLRASDSEEMMGGYTYNWVCSAFDNLLLLTCKNRCDIYISTSVFLYQYFQRRVNTMYKQEPYLSEYIDVRAGVYFKPFYNVLADCGVRKLKSSLTDMRETYSENIYADFTQYLAEQLQEICMRTLIVEMHICKSAGKLKGENNREEYEYYCNKIVGEMVNIKKMFEKYPVLHQCVEKRITYSINFYKEILEHFSKHRATICDQLCRANCFLKIVSIESKHSDVHRGGRHVVKVRLDDGSEILYKPHSMENEKQFGELLHWMSQGLKIAQLDYKFLSYEDHSWCSIVEYKSCKTEDEIKKYYKRIGVQLFLAYFLGTHDLHCENIIASGEYPVLIDLETIVNVQPSKKRVTADEEVNYQLAHSVLYTGLLPIYTWNKDKCGIDNSGISGGTGNYYPFKVPTVSKAETSDMHIVYDYPKATQKQNLVILQDRFPAPVKYEEKLLEGFSLAYQYVLWHKEEFKKKIEKLSFLKSRMLVADTQRYSMILSSSYHPSLLMNENEREAFFISMLKGRNESEDRIAKDEMNCLSHGDIPYYEYHLNDKKLYSGMGDELGEYFEEAPINSLLKKIDDLNEADMKKQQRYMQTALELMPSSREKYENGTYYVSENPISLCNKETKNKYNRQIEQLIERVIEEAVWNQERTEVNWCQTKLSTEKQMTWNIGAMGMYLYSGLAGMLLLFHELKQFSYSEKVEEIYYTLQKMLFRYSDKGMESINNLQSDATGAYDGESSIVYAYLILYEKSKDIRYLKYAEQHVQIVEKLIDRDKRYDMLSGNAGAAYVLLKLYKHTGNSQYLYIAEQAIEILQKNSEKQQKGIGWRIVDDLPPMSGMAHGNAGILMPVIELWKETRKKKYKEMAEEIWQYEESLYDVNIQNWLDVRCGSSDEEQIGAVAWCHGAGGILISRIYCNALVDDEMWKKRFEKDISRAYEKLKRYWKRDSWSLCHGICGNLWILNQIDEFMDININECIKLLPQEILNPGFMNGYGGIIYYCLMDTINKYES